MKKITGLSLIALVCFTACVTNAQGLKEAIHLTDNEQYEDAASIFRRLIVSEPSNGTNYYYFGENYLQGDNPDSALMMYQKGRQVDPNNTLNTIGMAKHRLSTGDPKTSIPEANALIDEALAKAGPKNVQALIEAAEALIEFNNKDLDKAKLLLDKASALDPKNVQVKILYGDIGSALHNGTLGAQYYNEALDLDKNSTKAIVSKGKLYRGSTNFEGAAEEYKNAIRIDPSYAPAHRELGEVYWKLGKTDLAKAEYKTYLDLSRNNVSARIRYASFLYATKDYAGALNEVKQIIQLSKGAEDNLTVLRIEAYCYYETKDSAQALVAVQKLFTKLTPEKTVGTDYEYYGKILISNNQDSLGVIRLRKAYDLDPSRCDLLSELYKSYDKMKRFGDAAAVLQERIAKCKGITATEFFYLGRSYYFNHEFQRADTAFGKLGEISPKYATGFLWRAKANAQIDSTMENGSAKPYYEKYIELATGDTSAGALTRYKQGLIEAYRYMAAYYVQRPQTVDHGKAKEFLKKILELDPEDKPAIEGIKSLEGEKNKGKPK